MDTKFTKGPFRYNRHDRPISGTAYHEIYTDHGESLDEFVCHASTEANANLFIAAPKMYALLDKLLNAGSWYSSALEIDTYEGFDGQELKKMIEMVLAEARGEE